MRKQSKNSLVHGVYSSDTVLPWERAAQFRELVRGLQVELCPVGILENRIVYDIAQDIWRKNRVNRHTQLALRQSPMSTAIVNSGKRGTKGISAYLKGQRGKDHDFAKDKKRAKQLANIVPGLNLRKEDETRYLGYIQRFEDILALMSDAGRGLDDLNSLIDPIANGVELEARIDAKIDRSMQRLAAAKEFKRIYGLSSTLIPGPRVEQNDDSGGDDARVRAHGSESGARDTH